MTIRNSLPTTFTILAFGLMSILTACDTANGDETFPANNDEPEAEVNDAAALLDTLFAGYDADLLDALRPDTTGAESWVQETLDEMTLQEKIGQLFIVNLDARQGMSDRLGANARQAVQQHNVGGFLVSRILGPDEVYEQTSALQELSNYPLFFAADYERAPGRFNNNFTELPSNMALGATREANFAAAAGRLTAIESRAIGVNYVFAPVADVNNNPDNPIINIRAYGEQPQLVGDMATEFVREAERFGLLTTLKHFPGHGNTSIDTHARLGTITSSRAELDSVELAPFRQVIDAGAKPSSVMTAHLWMEALDDDPIPATFSERVLRELLREEIGFEGIIVTDDVEMGALSNEYSLSERTVRPLEVSADIILTPDNLGAAIRAVESAVQEGRLSEERIEESARRVLRAKAKAGLHNERVPPEAILQELMAEPRGQGVAQTASDRAITLLETTELLPIQPEENALLLQLSNYRGAESIEAAKAEFAQILSEEANVNVQNIDEEPSAGQRDQALAAAEQADIVVLSLYLRLQSGRGEAGLFAQQDALVQDLLQLDVPVVLVTFGNPYAVETYPDFDAALVAYDQTLATVHSAAQVLQGHKSPQGRLPITIGGYTYGSGLSDLDGTPLADE